MCLDREGITESEKQIRSRLNKAEDVLQLKEEDDAALSERNFHIGKKEGLKLALAIVLSNMYSPEIENS